MPKNSLMEKVDRLEQLFAAANAAGKKIMGEDDTPAIFAAAARAREQGLSAAAFQDTHEPEGLQKRLRVVGGFDHH